MDLKQLRYFLALANEGSFSRASEQLHMAQPPLTRQIQGLEEELGTQLFVRTPRGVELTGAGEVLFQEVPNILALGPAASYMRIGPSQDRYACSAGTSTNA